MIKKAKEAVRAGAQHSHGLSLVDIAVLFEIALHNVTTSIAAIYVFIGVFQGAHSWGTFKKAVVAEEKTIRCKLKNFGYQLAAVSVVVIGWGFFMAKDFAQSIVNETDVT
jgi:hypothetical protein